MKKKGDDSFGHDFLNAMNVLSAENFISYDCHDDSRNNLRLEGEMSKGNKVVNPENHYIIKECFEDLSPQAKEILIAVVFWSDALIEVLGEAFPKGRYAKQTRQKKVFDFIESRGFNLSEVFQELKNFVDVYFKYTGG